MGVFVATTTALSAKMIGTVFDTATSALATECITDAEAEVMKHISERYDLTQFYQSTTVCPLLNSLSRDLAIAYMYDAMSRGSKEADARAERKIKRVMDNLALLRDGQVQLTDNSGNIIDEMVGKWQTQSNTTDYSPTFNEDHPRNWRQDRDKLEDIKDERES